MRDGGWETKRGRGARELNDPKGSGVVEERCL